MFFTHVARPLKGLFACVLVVSAVSGCSRQASVPEPIRAVKLIEVGAHARNAEVEYAGDVRARTESRLGFQVAGKVSKRWVDVGDEVKQGQVLAELDSKDYALAVQAAQAQVAAAKTQRDLAQADWQRFSALKDKGFISAVELDRRHANLQAAQAQLQQAQAQAAAQGNQNMYTRLLADAAGVVTLAQAEPGQVVTAGTPVLQLAHDGPRDVVIAVPEGVHSQIKPGQPVQVRLWAQGGLLDGEVREVGASADPATRTYAVKVRVLGEQKPALGATAYVRMASEKESDEQVQRLPSTAVRENAGASVVWEFDPQTSTVHARKVDITGVDGNDVLIAPGVQSGVLLVATGTHVLTEGQKVSVYKSPHAAVER